MKGQMRFFKAFSIFFFYISSLVINHSYMLKSKIHSSFIKKPVPTAMRITQSAQSLRSEYPGHGLLV